MKKWILVNWKIVCIIILGVFLLWQLYAIRTDVRSIRIDVNSIAERNKPESNFEKEFITNPEKEFEKEMGIK